ncbi:MULTISPECIES: hypothetical protein [unclassified Streptomyces]|uniref:hypothetical protein n=1 Tax=unclassified Streptomyces TaxID=2593676 RepID=UPI001319C664|nr:MULTISPECIES: hypothetical protein [unclassified Streptomyces]MYT30145.1 hypothetical protein [Streptomyces sp. SID8354]
MDALVYVPGVAPPEGGVGLPPLRVRGTGALPARGEPVRRPEFADLPKAVYGEENHR